MKRRHLHQPDVVADDQVDVQPPSQALIEALCPIDIGNGGRGQSRWTSTDDHHVPDACTGPRRRLGRGGPDRAHPAAVVRGRKVRRHGGYGVGRRLRITGADNARVNHPDTVFVPSGPPPDRYSPTGRTLRTTPPANLRTTPPAGSPTPTFSNRFETIDFPAYIALYTGGAQKVGGQGPADFQVEAANLSPLNGARAATANADRTCTAVAWTAHGVGFDVQNQRHLCVQSRTGDIYLVEVAPSNDSEQRPLPYVIGIECLTR